MFVNYLKNISYKLIQNEFSVLTAFGDGENISERTFGMVLQKNESPIYYLISVIDAEKIPPLEYQKQIQIVLKQIEEDLDQYHCNHLVCINMLVSDKDETKEMVSHQQYLPDTKVLQVWWNIRPKEKILYVPQGQPDEILNIGTLARQAVEEEVECNNAPISFRQFEEAAKKSAEMKKKSDGIELTLGLVLLNAGIFILLLISGNLSQAIFWGGSGFDVVIGDGEYYRLITSMFLHGGLAHVIGNCIYLYVFGSRTEKYYGRTAFLLIYYSAGLGGDIISILFNSHNTISIGASCAIYGLLGAVFALSQIQKRSIDGLSFFTILIIFFPGLAFGMGDGGIDIWGHIGGALCGYLLGLVLMKKENQKC
ncbi:MAG: rhomboid family intramembrane serine protease [Clostridiales bacterium]|nr:rhomboid family intramembrane serine protease [Clostridiales bacterium]